MAMKIKMASEDSSVGSSRQEQVMKPDDVNVLEFGELIDDICSDYVEQEPFNADNVIDSYDFFYNQSNGMFMNNNVNEGNGAESFLPDFCVGEEVSVATINSGEELSIIEIDSINNLYDAIYNESELQTENVPELFNMEIDKPEQLNFNSQQDISYVNHFDTELGQNIWYDENLENIVPNFDCDILPFSEVGLNYSDHQQVNSLVTNKSGNCNKFLQSIIDHKEYTISPDVVENGSNYVSLNKNVINDSFYNVIASPSPSFETVNVTAISNEKPIENVALTNQNHKGNLNKKHKSISPLTCCKSSINSSRFQHVMKIQNVYVKYCHVDSPLKFNKMGTVNKTNKIGNLKVDSRINLKNIETPKVNQLDYKTCKALMEVLKGLDYKTKVTFLNKFNNSQPPIDKYVEINRKDKQKSVGISTDALMQTINNEKVNILPKKQFLEADCFLMKIRKFYFSGNYSLLNILSSKKRSPKMSSELCKDNFINNNEKVLYYTGIPGYPYFIALLNCLDLPNIPIATPFEMLLLTLVKIKLNLDWTDLAYRFGESVECVKDIFGLTVSILVNCLPKLIQWLPEFIDFGRRSLIFYIFKVDLIPQNSGEIESVKERVFICLSNSTHPVLFISNPTSKYFSTAAELLEKTGIRQGVEHEDIVVFDNSVSLLVNDISGSVDSSKRPTNLIPLDKRIFQVQVIEEIRLLRKLSILNKPLLNQVRNVQKKAASMFNFSFLNDSICCEWLNGVSYHELFCDVLRIVCGLMNLCHSLPFSKGNVKALIDERKKIKVALL